MVQDDVHVMPGNAIPFSYQRPTYQARYIREEKNTMKDSTMSRRVSPNYLIFALILFTLSSYRIFISTIGLSRSSQNASSIDTYRAEFLPKSEGDNNNLNAQISSYPRVGPMLSNLRTFDESKLPYKCGMVFFYHIACTGGASMNRWLGKEKENNYNVSYYTHWGRKDQAQDTFIEGVEERVQNFGPQEWRIVHAHGHSFMPNTSEPYLYKWREEVEKQGCGFVATTMLRDAIGHTVSQTKGMILPNYTLDEFVDHLMPENYNQRGIFNTQIDYLIYNRGPRNQHNATKEEKVRRAIELLQRHFDIVLISDYERWVNIMVKVTGWEGHPMKHTNSFDGELNYTEREMYKIKTLTEANGDVLFLDAVKHIYYGHLDYLLD